MTDAVHGDERRDVVIVGAGVAGVSCAIECVDIQLDTAVFETHGRPGGQLVEIPHSVRNVATGPPRTGSSLRDSLEDSAAILGDRLRLSHPGHAPPTSVSDGSKSTGRASELGRW